MENADVVQCRYSQDGHSELLPQHAARSAAQAAQEPGHEPPGPGVAPQLTVTYVAQQGQQEEQGGTFIGPAHDARHRLRVDGVRGEEQAGQHAPQASSKQQASQGGKQACHSPVDGHINQVVTPGLQPTHSMVQAEGEGAEGPVRLMAATVCEQGAPEVIVEDVCPRGLWKQVLISLDCTAVKRTTKVRNGFLGTKNMMYIL